MDVLGRIDLDGSVAAIGISARRVVVFTSGRKLYHALLADDGRPVTLDRISGNAVGKALESRECILEADQVRRPGRILVPLNYFPCFLLT
jgi:hypothetical protein